MVSTALRPKDIGLRRAQQGHHGGRDAHLIPRGPEALDSTAA
jgi:hypothetical protein